MDLRSVGGDVSAEYVVTFFQIFTSVNYRLQTLVLVLRFQGGYNLINSLEHPVTLVSQVLTHS